MTIGIKVDFLWYPIGEDSFLHSFFSTVCLKLEDGKWGDRFAYIMKNLYEGKLKPEESSKALTELSIIQEELKAFAPTEVIWDAHHLSKQPPWGDNISPNIKNLSEYFVTSDGKCLIDVIKTALKEAIDENVELIIVKL